MKKWLGFIAILFCLIPLPVMAIGVSPYLVEVDIPADGFVDLEFVVTGCSEVHVSLESIPLAVEPSHILVESNQITVRIYGDLSKPTETYQGYLVILESGQQVGSGVKVSLIVNHINNGSVILTATVLSSSGSGVSYYGGGYRYVEPDYSAATVPIAPTVTVPPVVSVPPAYAPPPPNESLPQVTPAVGVPMPTEQGNIHIGWFLIGGGILVIGFMAWYLWGKRRKPKEIEPSQPI